MGVHPTQNGGIGYDPWLDRFSFFDIEGALLGVSFDSLGKPLSRRRPKFERVRRSGTGGVLLFSLWNPLLCPQRAMMDSMDRRQQHVGLTGGVGPGWGGVGWGRVGVGWGGVGWGGDDSVHEMRGDRSLGWGGVGMIAFMR